MTLLRQIVLSSLTRDKQRDTKAIPAFTRPEESVYEDANGEWFVLKQGQKAYDELKLQYFNDEEADSSKTI